MLSASAGRRRSGHQGLRRWRTPDPPGPRGWRVRRGRILCVGRRHLAAPPGPDWGPCVVSDAEETDGETATPPRRPAARRTGHRRPRGRFGAGRCRERVGTSLDRYLEPALRPGGPACGAAAATTAQVHGRPTCRARRVPPAAQAPTRPGRRRCHRPSRRGSGSSTDRGLSTESDWST